MKGLGAFIMIGFNRIFQLSNITALLLNKAVVFAVLFLALGNITNTTIQQAHAQSAEELPLHLVTSQQGRAVGLPTNKRLVKTSDGTLHTFVQLGTATTLCNEASTNNLVWLYSLDNGTTWTCGGQVSNQQIDNVSAVVDASDNVHLVISRTNSGAGNQIDVFYNRLTKGVGSSWSLGTQHIALNGVASTAGYSNADIELEGSDRIWIAARYFNNTNYQVVAYYSDSMTPSATEHWTQSGGNFSTPGANASYHIPSLVRFGDNLGIVYTSQGGTGQLHWRQRADTDDLGEWSSETTIVNAGINSTAFKAVADDVGNVHLAYLPTYSLPSISGAAHYAFYDGESWGTPFQLGIGNGFMIAIATDGTDVFVMYEDQPLINNVSGKLYYKKGIAPFGSGDFDTTPTGITGSQGYFDKVWSYIDGVYSDETEDAASTSTGDTSTVATTGDIFYLGKTVAFDSATWTMGPATGGTVVWEYWDGGAWSELSFISSQNPNLTAAGRFSFTAPSDWEPTAINGEEEEYYYIRARATGNYSTAPLLAMITASVPRQSLTTLETITTDLYFLWAENPNDPFRVRFTHHQLSDPGLAVASITPNAENNDQNIVPFSITGTGFQDGAIVELVPDSGPTITATDVVVESSTTITGVFDLDGVAVGTYDVVITNLDETFAILEGGFVVNEALPKPEGEWLTDWEYRQKIIIDADNITEDLTDFPVLVNTTSTSLRDNAQADADDIAFTAANGTTLLDHEIGRW